MLAWLLASVSGLASLPPNAKNVLFIPMDDQRPAAKAFNQSFMETPAMDRMVREGTTFIRAFANFAWCAPSRNSFMSGRRPDVTKAWDFQHHFRETLPNATTLPGAFKNAGWWASSVGKVYHPNLPPNCDGNLSWSGNLTQFPVCGPNKKGSVFGYRNWNHHDAGGPQANNGTFDDCDANIVDMALKRLAYAADQYHSAASRPFFLAVGLRSVHIPYHFPPSFADLYPAPSSIDLATHLLMDASQPLVAWYDQSGTSLEQGIGTYGDVRASGDIARGRAVNATEQHIIRRNYYAATSYSDTQLGRLLRGLDDLGLTNSTVVVCFGDHGQGLGEHNLWEKVRSFVRSRVCVCVCVCVSHTSVVSHTSASADVDCSLSSPSR